MCNKDCLNCTYSDCINDDDLTEEVKIVESDGISRDTYLNRKRNERYYNTEKGKKNRLKNVQEYYKRNKAKCQEYGRKYYQIHKDEILAKRREKRHEIKCKTQECCQAV